MLSSVSRVATLTFKTSIRAIASSSAHCSLPLKEGEAVPLPSEDRVISTKVAQLVDEIANLSLLDVSDLNWALKKRLNIPDQPMMSPGMIMATAAPQAQSSSEAEAAADVPQKMTFSVKLTKYDDAKKIALIKEIRAAMPNLNLFVETAPVVVKDDMGKQEAEDLKAALEKAGATIEIV